jgi:hypothetical protein
MVVIQHHVHESAAEVAYRLLRHVALHLRLGGLLLVALLAFVEFRDELGALARVEVL